MERERIARILQPTGPSCHYCCASRSAGHEVLCEKHTITGAHQNKIVDLKCINYGEATLGFIAKVPCPGVLPRSGSASKVSTAGSIIL